MTALWDFIDTADPWAIATFVAVALWLLTEWQLRRARDRWFHEGLAVGERLARLNRPRR